MKLPVGHAYEIGQHDYRLDWGTIIHYQAPHSFTLLWQISQQRVPIADMNKASEVHMKFQAENDSDSDRSTNVDIIHDRWDKHGEGWETYEQQFQQYDVWNYVLDCFNKYAESN